MDHCNMFLDPMNGICLSSSTIGVALATDIPRRVWTSPYFAVGSVLRQPSSSPNPPLLNPLYDRMWVTVVRGFGDGGMADNLVRITKEEVTARVCGQVVVVRNGTLAIVRGDTNWDVIDTLNRELPVVNTFTPAGKIVDASMLSERAVSVSHTNAQLWDYTEGQLVNSITRRGVTDARFSSNNFSLTALSTSTRHLVTIYDHRMQSHALHCTTRERWENPRLLYFVGDLVLVTPTGLLSTLVCFDTRTGNEVSRFSVVADDALICRTASPDVVFCYQRNSKSMRGWALNLRTGVHNIHKRLFLSIFFRV